MWNPLIYRAQELFEFIFNLTGIFVLKFAFLVKLNLLCTVIDKISQDQLNNNYNLCK